jgi:hypothetical protein
VRADQKPGQEEANDTRKTDLLAQKAADAGEKRDHCQVLNEIQLTHATLPPFHKNSGRSWWDDKTTGRPIVARLPDDKIGIGVPEDRMQFQRNSDTLGQINGFLNFVGVEKYHQTPRLRIERSAAGVENDHHDQSLLLVSANIVELHPLLDFFPSF